MIATRLLAMLGPLLFLGVAACSTAEGPREGFAATDPYEPTNRAILKGNIRLDRYVLRPATMAYDTVAPETVQHLVTNGLAHLGLANDFANYVLQADVDGSLNTLGRFTINTVLGAGGLLNPADEFGLPRQQNDFGLTLARYGVGEGPYLVLPLLGPTTARDAGGFAVDRTVLSPTMYIGIFTPMDGVGPTSTGMGFVDARNRNFDLIDELLYDSEDPYVTLRAAYLQRRRAQVAGGDDPGARLPDIFDDEAPAPSQ